MLSQSHFMKEV